MSHSLTQEPAQMSLKMKYFYIQYIGEASHKCVFANTQTSLCEILVFRILKSYFHIKIYKK